MDLQNTSILEIYFPVDSLLIKPILNETTDQNYKLKEELLIECTPESTAQLLALAVDHIDILLEDWYPTLGTRFVHTSEGKFLVTRLVPCPKCLTQSTDAENLAHFPNEMHKQALEVKISYLNNRFLAKMLLFNNLQNIFKPLDEESENACLYHQNRFPIRKSQESYTSECDSGVGPDSGGSSRMPSVEGHPNITIEDPNNSSNQVVYSWMVEECILAAYGLKTVLCPEHSDMALSQIAPDTVRYIFFCYLSF